MPNSFRRFQRSRTDCGFTEKTGATLGVVERSEAAETVRQFVSDQAAAGGVDPELLAGLAGTSEAKIRSLDPDPEVMAERRERHSEAWGAALEIDVPNEDGVSLLDEAIVDDWNQEG